MTPQQCVEETSFSFSRAVPPAGERRQQQRHMTILRVGALMIGDQRELCLIRNISAGGLKAHVYCPLSVDQRVTVELKTNQLVEGRVVWIEENNVGIGFDEAIDVAELLANPPVLPNGWRPRMPRVDIDTLATLRIGARLHWVQALDISQGGVKFESDQPLETGTDAVITLEGFRPLQGVLRWQKDGQAGIVFNQLIPFGELIAWLKRS